MGHSLLHTLLLLAATAIPPLEAAADHGGRLVGVHEIPVFVRERIELTPGTFDDGEPPADPRPRDRSREDAASG